MAWKVAGKNKACRGKVTVPQHLRLVGSGRGTETRDVYIKTVILNVLPTNSLFGENCILIKVKSICRENEQKEKKMSMKARATKTDAKYYISMSHGN